MDLSIATRGRPIINLTISLGCPGVYIHDYWLLRWPIAWLHGISRRCTLGPRGCTHDQLNWLKYIRLNHIDQLRYIHVQQWVLLLWVPSFQWHKNNHKFQKIQIICEDLCRTIILYFLFFFRSPLTPCCGLVGAGVPCQTASFLAPPFSAPSSLSLSSTKVPLSHPSLPPSVVEIPFLTTLGLTSQHKPHPLPS